MVARIYLCWPRKHFGCSRNYLALPWKFIQPANIFLNARKYFINPRNLLCFMRGFLGFFHFGNAVVPWLANWSIVGSFGTLDGVSNASPYHMISYLGYLIWVQQHVCIKKLNPKAWIQSYSYWILYHFNFGQPDWDIGHPSKIRPWYGSWGGGRPKKNI